MSKVKIGYFCSDCGNEYPKWQGKCPACGSWNTLTEQKIPSVLASKGSAYSIPKASPIMLSDVDMSSEDRFSTGSGELDRVLGGGAVKGSLVLVGGAPGIGKSTLLLQLCAFCSKDLSVLYVTGEESGKQLKMRAVRLGSSSDRLSLLIETNITAILDSLEDIPCDVVVIDSVQTMYNDTLEGAPGSVGQVKDCTMALMRYAKSHNTTIFIVGHINKDGNIAGPKVLEHMVDCVLYFEGEQASNYRILRSAKNRFGSTNEIGVFEMLDTGLSEVPNPSELLLEGRPAGEPGTCVTCVMEGTRPVLAEIQALLAPTSFNVPRRNSNGVDYNRAMLLLAVLEKRGGLKLSQSDAYINVIGGLELNEPAADLATILALASSFLDRPIADCLAAVGEVGLTGEIRNVNALEQRLSEVSRLGFTVCVVPKRRKGDLKIPAGLKIIEAANIREALSSVLGAKRSGV